MTLSEFLSALELCMNRALHNSVFVSDGFSLRVIPKNHTGPIEGIVWTLGEKMFQRKLTIHLTHKAFVAWGKGQFEMLLPDENADDWLEVNDEQSSVTMRLRSQSVLPHKKARSGQDRA